MMIIIIIITMMMIIIITIIIIITMMIIITIITIIIIIIITYRFKTSFYVVRHLDSIASYLPTGLHLGFFRSWPSLYLP